MDFSLKPKLYLYPRRLVSVAYLIEEPQTIFWYVHRWRQIRSLCCTITQPQTAELHVKTSVFILSALGADSSPVSSQQSNGHKVSRLLRTILKSPLNKPDWLFPIWRTCQKQTVARCVPHMKECSWGQCPNLSLLMLSGINLWKMLES